MTMQATVSSADLCAAIDIARAVTDDDYRAGGVWFWFSTEAVTVYGTDGHCMTKVRLNHLAPKLVEHERAVAVASQHAECIGYAVGADAEHRETVQLQVDGPLLIARAAQDNPSWSYMAATLDKPPIDFDGVIPDLTQMSTLTDGWSVDPKLWGRLLKDANRLAGLDEIAVFTPFDAMRPTVMRGSGSGSEITMLLMPRRPRDEAFHSLKVTRPQEHPWKQSERARLAEIQAKRKGGGS